MTKDDAKVIVIEGNPVYDLRAFYAKEGRAKYCSHLDLYRTIQRAFARSKLPIWFTQGFNPHSYLTFALPIALGYEGVQESFDFRMTEWISPEETAQRLNAVMPEGIRILAVASPREKPAAIAAADYTLRLGSRDCLPEKLLQQLIAFLEQPEIPVVKRTKKGNQTIDLKPLIQHCKLDAESDGVHTVLTLPAGPIQNINPTLLFDAFAAAENLSLDYLLIRRDRILCATGEVFA